MADYEAVRRLVRLHPKIDIEGVSGNPPDRYLLVLHVRSLRERGAEIDPVDTHRLEISLPGTYPRDAPLFRMLTPVFHPNIAPRPPLSAAPRRSEEHRDACARA
jgi:hypothetical protein